MRLEQGDLESNEDYWKRENSERDRTRTRAPARAFGDPTEVAHWKCRRPGCSEVVGITETGLEAWESFNRQLAKQGGPPLDTATICFCKPCAAIYQAMQAELAQKKRARVSMLVDELKADPGPGLVRRDDIVKQLNSLGCETGALLAAIRDRREAKSSKRARGDV